MRVLVFLLLLCAGGGALSAAERDFGQIGLTVRFPEHWKVFSERGIGDRGTDVLRFHELDLAHVRDARLEPLLQITRPTRADVGFTPCVAIFFVAHDSERPDPRVLADTLNALKARIYADFVSDGPPSSTLINGARYLQADARYTSTLSNGKPYQIFEQTYIRSSRHGYLFIDVKTAAADQDARRDALRVISRISLQ